MCSRKFEAEGAKAKLLNLTLSAKLQMNVTTKVNRQSYQWMDIVADGEARISSSRVHRLKSS